MPVAITKRARQGLFHLINQIRALLNRERLLGITYDKDEGRPLCLYWWTLSTPW